MNSCPSMLCDADDVQVGLHRLPEGVRDLLDVIERGVVPRSKESSVVDQDNPGQRMGKNEVKFPSDGCVGVGSSTDPSAEVCIEPEQCRSTQAIKDARQDCRAVAFVDVNFSPRPEPSSRLCGQGRLYLDGVDVIGPPTDGRRHVPTVGAGLHERV